MQKLTKIIANCALRKSGIVKATPHKAGGVYTTFPELCNCAVFPQDDLWCSLISILTTNVKEPFGNPKQKKNQIR